MSPGRRILILAATTGYQTTVFREAARRLGFDAVMATDRCNQLEDPWGDDAIPVRFDDPESAAEVLAGLSPRPDGVVAVGDRPALIAAMAAQRLDLLFHPPHAVARCRNKFEARECFRSAHLPTPSYFRVALSADPVETAAAADTQVGFPCVLKPLGLSASRGVIRANDPEEFTAAFRRIRSILAQPEIRRLREEQDQFLQIEAYIPGDEFALEGLVRGGQLRTLALFDKPDPLEGPFFEETIYVTPSRASGEIQRAIQETVQAGASALGLTDGPLHAEMRVNQNGVYLLEIAARPIGGLCAQSLRFAGRIDFEELLLRAATGEDVTEIAREDAASGVMMIPVPASGVFQSVEGVSEALAVPHVTDAVITAKQGQRMQRLPEGASYPGFLFARAESPELVEAALREAHGKLRFQVMPELPALRPGS